MGLSNLPGVPGVHAVPVTLPPATRNESFPGHSTLPVVAILSSSLNQSQPHNQSRDIRSIDVNQSEAELGVTQDQQNLVRRVIGGNGFQPLASAASLPGTSSAAVQLVRSMRDQNQELPPQIDMMGPIRVKETLPPHSAGPMRNKEGGDWQTARNDSRKMKQNSRSRKFK